MAKKTLENLIVQKMIDTQIRSNDLHKSTVGVIKSIAGLLKTMIRHVYVLYFLVGLLLGKVFLFEPVNHFLDIAVEKWRILSEPSKVAIFIAIISIPLTIVEKIAYKLLWMKFFKQLEDKK